MWVDGIHPLAPANFSRLCALQTKLQPPADLRLAPQQELSESARLFDLTKHGFDHQFAFTGIDIYTKEAAVMLRLTLTSDDGAAFLHTAMARRCTGRVEVLQPDGGQEFKEAFARQARAYCDRHHIARPYKKKEQVYIESFNRTLRRECLGWGTYRAGDLARLIPEVETFLARYHYHRPHLGFSPMRPPLQTPLTGEEELSDIYGGYCALLTLDKLYIKLPPTGREKGAMVDNFPAVWLSLDGLCCRRCGRAVYLRCGGPKGDTSAVPHETGPRR